MMMSRIFSAYVAGLCPLLELMDPAKQAPDRHRRPPAAAAGDETSAEFPSRPPRRRRLLLVALGLALAVGAWQLLSRTEERRAAIVSAQDAASWKGALLFVLIMGLAIGAGELLSHVDKARAADVPAKASASEKRAPVA